VVDPYLAVGIHRQRPFVLHEHVAVLEYGDLSHRQVVKLLLVERLRTWRLLVWSEARQEPRGRKKSQPP
jgi:hypothetical protein